MTRWLWRTLRWRLPNTLDSGRLPVATAQWALLAALCSCVAWGTPAGLYLGAVGAIVVAVATCRRRQTRWAVVGLVLVVLAAVRADAADTHLSSAPLGRYVGWATVTDEAQVYHRSTRVMLAVGEHRYEAWFRGRASQIRAQRWRGGDRLWLSGQRLTLDSERARRVRWQSIAGELRVDWVGDRVSGGPIARASNRVRSALEQAAQVLPEHDGALYRGLVIGDDQDQPHAMIERFRASGLSHLTAVSGQNISFVLAVAGPALVRLRPIARWGATLCLIAWFVSMTRFEPSIVRAGCMAGLSATGFLLGRERSAARLLWVAVVGLIVVDPVMVGAIGFWLSVGATWGVAVVGPWLTARLSALGVLAPTVGVTLGAQIGVALPALLVFGKLSVMSIPANLLAVPIGGAVMLYGLPAGIGSALVPAVAPVLMFPVHVGVRWVDTVAAVGAQLEPEPDKTLFGWFIVGGICLLAALVSTLRGSEVPADGVVKSGH